MQCASRRIAPIVVCLIAGCTILENMPLTAYRPARNEALLERLAEARSIEEIEQSLELLVTDESAQANVETLLSGWGKYGSWHDLQVVIFLQKCWPSAYGHWENLDAKPLIPIIQSRIRENPELNRQLYWFEQWRWGPMDFPRYCNDLTNGTIFDVVVGGEEFIPLMRVSGAMNDSYYLLSADWENLAGKMWTAQLHFLSKRPFLRYDDQLGHYVVDAEAMREGRYLARDVQQATERPTPLPDWDHPMIPERLPRSNQKEGGVI